MKLMVQVAAAAAGSVAFGAIMGVTSDFFLYCAVTGGAGWAVYVVLWQMLGIVPEPAAVFFATVLVTFCARLFAIRKRCPVTVFLVSGILPVVPGAGIFWTAYYLVVGQPDVAVGRGFSAIKAAIAIVLGSGVVFELPQSFFGRLMGQRTGKRKGGKA